MLSLLTSPFSTILQFVVVWLFGIVGGMISIMANALSFSVSVRAGGNVPVVAASWTILRDFSNMLFIVILVYVAFATIFDQGNYTFQKTIVRFVIVAILINFSLVIGNLVIDFCQVLANIFLGSIGNLGDRLGTYLNPIALLPSGVSAQNLADTSLVSLVFALILGLMFLFSLVVALVFAIIRVPFIWTLLIISPLAWMAHILPSSENLWKKWWGLFWGWNLFLPVYLFFMYLGLLFLSKRAEIVDAVLKLNNVNGVNPANAPLVVGLTSGLSFNLLFFYIFTGVILVGGTWAATKVTTLMTGSEYFAKGLGWAKWAVKNVPLGRFGSLQNYENAVVMRKDQLMREGAFGYLGTEKSQRKTAGIASNRLLFGGVRDVKDKQLGTDVSTWKSRFNNLDTNQLRQQMNSGPIHQQLAMRELLKDRGQLSTKEMENTYDLYNKTSPPSAIKFANSIDYGRLSSLDRQDWYNETTNIELKKKIANSMADKGDLKTPAAIQQASSLFTLDSDKADFIKKAARRITDVGQLRTMMNTGSSDEQLAVRQILTDKGELSADELLQTYNMFEDGSQSARDYGTKIKFENLKETDRNNWYNGVNDIEVKRKVSDVMADKGEFKNGTALTDATNNYKLEAEKKDFIKKAQKKQLLAASETRVNLGYATSVQADITDQLAKKQLGVKDLVELPTTPATPTSPSDLKAWGDPRFISALRDHISELQLAKPAIPATPAIPRAPGVPGRKATKGKPGGGDEFKSKLLREAGTDKVKLPIIRTL